MITEHMSGLDAAFSGLTADERLDLAGEVLDRLDRLRSAISEGVEASPVESAAIDGAILALRAITAP